MLMTSTWVMSVYFVTFNAHKVNVSDGDVLRAAMMIWKPGCNLFNLHDFFIRNHFVLIQTKLKFKFVTFF